MFCGPLQLLLTDFGIPKTRRGVHATENGYECMSVHELVGTCGHP